jgi:hypothetical protein
MATALLSTSKRRGGRAPDFKGQFMSSLYVKSSTERLHKGDDGSIPVKVKMHENRMLDCTVNYD